MIDIIGSNDVTEYKSAQNLRSLILTAWPDLMDSTSEKISIIVAAKCFGCQVQDIDLIVIGNLIKPRKLPPLPRIHGQKSILSFVWTIEVKGHPAEKVSFSGGKVLVPYHGNITKDATEQAFKQQNSLRDFLRRNINRDPFVSNLIWLENCTKIDLPKDIEFCNVVAGDSDWNAFLVASNGANRSWLLKPENDVVQAFNYTVNRQFLATKEICDLFTSRMIATPLDRKRLERITKRVIEDQEYAKKLGSQLLLFRGRGGTGKTITLIRLALDLHTNSLKRVLFLTYNVALVADIRRTLSIIQAPFDSEGPVVQVRTVHSFMLELMKNAGVINTVNRQALENYNQNLKELDELADAFSSADSPAFDFVFIDEAQDWPEKERDILFKLFGANRTIVADGVDQLVRSKLATDWTARIGNISKQVVPLKRSLRLKHGITSFANSLAEELGLQDWSLQSNPELSGGKITLLFGSIYSGDDSICELINKSTSGENLPIDSLVCVPWTSKISSSTRKILGLIERNGFGVWDGTDEEERRTFATSTNQMRVVSYESCRGLEGWNVYCFDIDKLYDQKRNSHEESSDLFQSKTEAAKVHAASWVMIPLTRSIDHLVLHVENEDHPLATHLKNVYEVLGRDQDINIIRL